MICIYALVDPRNRRIRYIGKTGDPVIRLRDHIRSVRDNWPSKNPHKERWIRQLLCAKMIPTLVVLAEVDETDADAAEREFITFGYDVGWPLTNISAGGGGGSTTLTSETARTKHRMGAVRGGQNAWKNHRQKYIKQLAASNTVSQTCECGRVIHNLGAWGMHRKACPSIAVGLIAEKS